MATNMNIENYLVAAFCLISELIKIVSYLKSSDLSTILLSDR